ncbi:MAG TPA: hypothetical protein VLC92_02660 [Rhodocyclaceae bacterium]|nr:hypothetical protein [Rhodocyclaceae bacterium]
MTHSSRRSRLVFAAFFVCAALTSSVAVIFFIIGLGDGTVSSFNLGLWSGLLAVMGLSLWAGYALRANGKPVLAIAALSVTAVPGLLMALFVLLLLITQPHWN